MVGIGTGELVIILGIVCFLGVTTVGAAAALYLVLRRSGEKPPAGGRDGDAP